jgi:hypothetical protein
MTWINVRIYHQQDIIVRIHPNFCKIIFLQKQISKWLGQLYTWIWMHVSCGTTLKQFFKQIPLIIGGGDRGVVASWFL